MSAELPDDAAAQADALWLFSLDVYGRERVKEALLTLQETINADVNLMLLACWLAQEHYPLDRDTAQTLREISRHWQSEIVVPLRGVRHRLKDRLRDRTLAERQSHADLRQQVLDLELQAERLEQQLLVRALGPLQHSSVDPLTLCLANLAALVSLSSQAEPHVRHLLSAIWPSTVDKMWEQASRRFLP
ncbi:MAG: TIGR02444 family protein [Pseudomonadota bacterium]